MLKLILDNLPPQLNTLAKAHAIIKTLWQLVGKLNERVEYVEEQFGG